MPSDTRGKSRRRYDQSDQTLPPPSDVGFSAPQDPPPAYSQTIEIDALSLEKEDSVFFGIHMPLELCSGKTNPELLSLDVPPQQLGNSSLRRYVLSHDAQSFEQYLTFGIEAEPDFEGYGPGTYLRNSPIISAEDDDGLSKLIGIQSNGDIIEDLCYFIQQGPLDIPSRFLDLSMLRFFSQHMFGTKGIGLSDFLVLVLIGAELAIRLNKPGLPRDRYSHLINEQVSASVIIGYQWVKNIRLDLELGAESIIISEVHDAQAKSLVHFAKALKWPYTSFVEENITNLYQKMRNDPSSVSDHLKDWLCGLELPGWRFRERIMSCLVQACHQTCQLGYCNRVPSGISVGKWSYWPAKTSLGRVLGGLKDVESTCGWIGPIPAPVGFSSGWFLVDAPKTEIQFLQPRKKKAREVENYVETSTSVSLLRLGDSVSKKTSWAQQLKHLWRSPQETFQLSAIYLTERDEKYLHKIKQYQSSLEFICSGRLVAFTIKTTPLFIYVPDCERGSHQRSKRNTNEVRAEIVQAKLLNSGQTQIPADDDLIIIFEAQTQIEGVMARAWCAEAGRNAIVRERGIGCSVCATNLASNNVGLGVNILIWCS